MIYAGIDLGGTTIKGALVSEDGKILIQKAIPTGGERPHVEVVTDMANLILELMSTYGCDPEEVEAVGVGSPGSIDPVNGIVVEANNFADFRDVHVRDIMAAILDKPIYVDNDANVAALGESMFGAGEGQKNCVLCTLGTGLGGGVVIDGKIFSGAYHGGTELGHTVIVADGEQCTCGRKGCWEAYSSATAIIREARKAAEADPESKINEVCGGDLSKLNAKMVFDAADMGDASAIRVKDDYIKYLGLGLTNMINIFQPEVMMIGGGVCAQGEKLLSPLRKILDREVFAGQFYKIKFRTATLGNDAGVIGAAMLGKINE